MSRPPAKLPATEKPASGDLARDLKPYLIPDKAEKGIEVVTTYIQKSHSGPLPAPEDFEHYDRVLPGGAERIMQLTEREQNHRHKQEGRMVIGEYASRIFGQFGALVALILLCAVVAYCASIGQPLTATVLGSIGAIVVAFLKYSSNKIEQEPEPPSEPRRHKGKRR